MTSNRLPPGEMERLEELRRLSILDTPPEQAFDFLTSLAAEIFGVPVSLISMVDQERVWLKSHHGIDVREFPRERSFCDFAIHGGDLVVIPDTRNDTRTSSHPFVTKKPGIRFYAAAPLRTRFGYNVGTLCIMDLRTRELGEEEKSKLKGLASLVVDAMEVRAARKGSVVRDAVSGKREAELAEQLLQEHQLFMGGPTVVFKWAAKRNWPVEYASPNVNQFGYEPEELITGKILYSQMIYGEDLARVVDEVKQFSDSGVDCFTQEYRILCRDGQVRWISDFTVVIRDRQGKVTHYHGYIHDITARRQAEESLRESWARYEAAIDSFDGLIYICSSDYKVEFMNRRLVDRTGRDGTGELCYKVLHERDSVCPWCVNESVSRGKTVKWEVQSPKDSRWYYIVNTPIRHADGTVSKMAMIQDITERRHADEQVKRREAILNAVAFASEQFLRTQRWDQNIREVLAQLGNATGASRVYVLENLGASDKEMATSVRFEWTAPGISPQIYNPRLQRFDYHAEGFSRWIQELGRGQVVHGHVREFPESERDRLKTQGVLSLAAVPVFVDKKWWGVIAFDSCLEERSWSSVELDALKTGAALMGAAVHRSQYEQALRESEARNRVLLDAMPDLMFRIRSDGTFLDFKADHASQLLVPPGEIIGRKVSDTLPPDVARESLRLLRVALETGSRQIHEYELLIDGKRRQFEARMVVSAKDEILSIVRDVTESKEAEAQIRKLGSAVEQAADSLMITDVNGIIEYVNPAFEKLTGYTADEVVGKTPAILKSGRHDKAFYDALWKSLVAGGVVHLDFVNRRKDGSTYYHGATIAPIKNAAGEITHFVSSGLDVTERMTAQEALKESERRLSTIIDFLPDATFAIDREGRVIAWNRAIERMTGTRAPDMLGRKDHEYAIPFYGQRQSILIDLVLHPDEEVERAYRYIERSGDTLIAEVQLPHISNGLFAWVTATPLLDTRGNVVGAIECIRDITDRKNAEEAIRKLAAFPQFNPNAVLEFTADGTCAYYNKAAKEMALSLGKEDPAAMLPPNARDIVWECLSIGRSRERIEVSIGKRTLSWSFFPIVETATVHAYGVDITDRLALETQMRHLQKMEAVGRLAGGVAHDFNNILTAILGYSSMVLVEEQMPESAISQIREIARAAERASHLTRQLLTFSRKQVIRAQILDVNEVLRSLSDMLRRLISEDIPLKFVYAADLPTIYADRTMLEQVMVNMVINARDAMPEGGQIAISTAVADVDLSHVRENPEAKTGRFVKVAVTDTGCGMDSDVKARIFEPFFTTKPEGQGTGLGLATAYGIVKQHDGWIDVSSEVNQGATFCVYLPIHSGVARGPVRSSAEETIRGGTETILVVEDERTVRMLASSVLARYGYKVLEASSGTEGLSLWRNSEGKIDLLLADVVMPGGLTGRELAEKLSAESRDLKIVLTSGYHFDAVSLKGAFGRTIRFLPKPFSPADLARTVRDVLDART